MERLTEKDCKTGWPAVKAECTVYEMTNRLAYIEDILGDDYDLDRLSELVNQRMTLREDVVARMNLVGGIPMDRLRELVEADRDVRCVVFQPGHPVVSEYYKEGDLCIREVAGVISKKEYMSALKGERDG